ncbi:hypothetical protein SAY87_018943 [Trapa incisa]|uniref:Protein kinase domain-containing protein n=1 Tax=Trapa incisa TaxID=236973 RepID=A0AAN7K3S1_9MYRT|nr:hypothetical protein SAY87_018943 [Trapa incisa]
MMIRFSMDIRLNHLLLSLLVFIYSLRAVSGQSWDGVIITDADYDSLQAFKRELVDPKGFLRGWNASSYAACSGGWAGIKCAQGQVIVIQLPWKSLGGRISEKVGQLQSLRKLSLHDNAISGPIPASLGFLPSLRGVQLFNNRLSGSIPPSLGRCPLLQTLDLSNNLLSGGIPGSLANSTKLFRLNLSFNSITGTIPVELTRAPSLIILDLQHNNLSGPLPPSVGNLKWLQRLDLSYNTIDGQIPASFDGLQNLSVVNLKGNRLSGPIPETLGNISTLIFLDLSLNDLSDGIPSSLDELINLSFLNVSYNNLSGPVSTHLKEKFNSSSFIGNVQLCGFKGSTPCPALAPSQLVPSTSPEITRSHHRHRGLSTKDAILIAAGALLLVLLVLCCILLCCLVSKRAATSRAKEGQVPRAEKGGGSRTEVEAAATAGEAGGKLVHFEGPITFTADDLLCATAEIMGKSTYGTVYKATLEDGGHVAVKRLREKITRGQKEFEAEVNLLGKVRHPNLIALRTYYLGPKGEKLLVFDYMPRGSLATFLHARGPDTTIDWRTRMRIMKGVTRGIMHLHHVENLIHGNLTSTNVLLDEGGEAKISDYALSRLMTPAAGSTVVAAAAALGYRAPELSKLKKANTKTDVYSLGVIFLELLTGKSPGEAMNGSGDLPQWVASIVKEEWTNEVFDVELMKELPAIGDELLNTLKLALHCVDPSPSARPEAQQILQQLEEIRTEGEPGAGSTSGPPPPGPSGDGGSAE